MNDNDFRAGQRGDSWSPEMDRGSFEAGQSKRKTEQAILGGDSGPKTPISGPGLVMLVTAPILAIMYPVAGLTTSAAGGILFKITGLFPKSFQWLQVLIVIAAMIASFIAGLKLELAASQAKPYRVFRHIFRMVVLTGLVFSALIHAGKYASFQSAVDHAPPPTLFITILAMLGMQFLFPMFDRLFFPARDGKAIAQEKKYAGMNEEEVFAVKNAKFHGILKFAAAWFVSTIAFSLSLHHVSVFLIACATFFVCYKFRNDWFFQKTAAFQKERETLNKLAGEDQKSKKAPVSKVSK